MDYHNAQSEGASSTLTPENKPTPTLDNLLADKVNRTGLGSVDLNLLKVLLMKKLINKPPTHQQATSSSLGDMVRWTKLGLDLEPKLSPDGTNFPTWLAAMCSLVDLVTGLKEYFSADQSMTDPTTSVGVMALVSHSVDVALRSSPSGMNVYGAYTSLKGLFAGSSWSLLLTRWSDIAQDPDLSDSVSSSYESIKRSLLDLEERLGGWTTDKLLSLSFHTSLKRYTHSLADSMDSRLAIDPSLQVKLTDLLAVATRLHQAHSSSSIPSGLMAISTQRLEQQPSAPSASRGGQGRGNPKGSCGGGRQQASSSQGGSSDSAIHPPNSWGQKYLTTEFP